MTTPIEPDGEFAEGAGDPGDAAELPPTTGRDAEAGIPDTEYHEQDGEPA